MSGTRTRTMWLRSGCRDENAIFMIRMLSECAIERQNDLYICVSLSTKKHLIKSDMKNSYEC